METPDPNSIKKGEQGQLICDFTTDINDASPTVTWWKGEEEITASDNLVIQSIGVSTKDPERGERNALTIKSLDSSHSRDDYSCKITLADTSVEQSKTVALHVLGRFYVDHLIFVPTWEMCLF